MCSARGLSPAKKESEYADRGDLPRPGELLVCFTAVNRCICARRLRVKEKSRVEKKDKKGSAEEKRRR